MSRSYWVVCRNLSISSVGLWPPLGSHGKAALLRCAPTRMECVLRPTSNHPSWDKGQCEQKVAKDMRCDSKKEVPGQPEDHTKTSWLFFTGLGRIRHRKLDSNVSDNIGKLSCVPILFSHHSENIFLFSLITFQPHIVKTSWYECKSAENDIKRNPTTLLDKCIDSMSRQQFATTLPTRWTDLQDLQRHIVRPLNWSSYFPH